MKKEKHNRVQEPLLGPRHALHETLESAGTTLVCKDRVTATTRSPVLYGQNFYYKRLQKVPLVIPEG